MKPLFENFLITNHILYMKRTPSDGTKTIKSDDVSDERRQYAHRRAVLRRASASTVLLWACSAVCAPSTGEHTTHVSPSRRPAGSQVSRRPALVPTGTIRQLRAVARLGRLASPLASTMPMPRPPQAAAHPSPAPGPEWQRRSCGESAGESHAVSPALRDLPPEHRWKVGRHRCKVGEH